MAEVSVDSLVSAGFTTLEQLQDATDEELSEKLSLSDSRIGDLRAAINFLSPVVANRLTSRCRCGARPTKRRPGKTNSMDRGHVPTRMCAICRRRMPKQELVRHVLSPQGGEFLVDESQTQPGRGWYVCSETACREKFRRFRTGGRKRKGD